MWGKGNPQARLVGKQIGAATMEISIEVSQKNDNQYYFLIWQFTFGYLSEGKHSQKNRGTPMFTAALFTLAKTWKQPKYP